MRQKIAQWLAPEREMMLDTREQDLNRRKEAIDMEVNGRVADIVANMDPFEPFLKRYHVIFSKEWERPEDRLSPQSKLQLFMWAHGMESDPSFVFLTDWIRNTQGNATLRKAKNDNEWFYGRAAIAVVTLLVDEVKRLGTHYRDILAKRNNSFDENLPVEL